MHTTPESLRDFMIACLVVGIVIGLVVGIPIGKWVL